MKVVVLGSGLAGITTAYFLARRGHEVELIDRREGAALETSFANAGLVVPSQSPPWSEPGVPWRALRWLLTEHGTLAIVPRFDSAMYRWLAAFTWNAQERRHVDSARATLRLATYSVHIMRQLRAESGITYEGTARGVLTIARHARALAGLNQTAARLCELGIECCVIDRAKCLAIEPALGPIAAKIVGGLHTPDDESGDAYLFVQELFQRLRGLGVRFRWQTTVASLRARAGHITAAISDGDAIEGDAFVVALGPSSRDMLMPLGLSLPIYPVKGHSLTVDVAGWDGLPSLPIREPSLKVAITPLGPRLRVAGMAILDGGAKTMTRERAAILRGALKEVFPMLPADRPETTWTGLRPMTSDGPPIIGKTQYENLFLNVGHGALGFTLACGSGSLVADLLSGHAPEISLQGLTADRFQQ